MLACRKGFLQIVYVLHDCPYLDVNLQDNEGNTALMIASQAGVYLRLANPNTSARTAALTRPLGLYLSR